MSNIKVFGFITPSRMLVFTITKINTLLKVKLISMPLKISAMLVN